MFDSAKGVTFRRCCLDHIIVTLCASLVCFQHLSDLMFCPVYLPPIFSHLFYDFPFIRVFLYTVLAGGKQEAEIKATT